MSSPRKSKQKRSGLTDALIPESQLRAFVEPGLQALGAYSKVVEDPDNRAVDSLDFDEAARPQYGSESRWDYFIGVASPGQRPGTTVSSVVAVEVHTATDGEVSVVIKKKRFTQPVMLQEMDGKPVQRWVWVASGNVRFSRNSKYEKLLATEGIEFHSRTVRL